MATSTKNAQLPSTVNQKGMPIGSDKSNNSSNSNSPSNVPQAATEKHGFPSNDDGDGGQVWVAWKRSAIKAARLARQQQKQQTHRLRQQLTLQRRQKQQQQVKALVDTSGRRESLKMRFQAISNGTEGQKVYRVISGPSGITMSRSQNKINSKNEDGGSSSSDKDENNESDSESSSTDSDDNDSSSSKSSSSSNDSDSSNCAECAMQK